MSGEEARSILLVEDNAILAINEARILTEAGYEVEVAYSGETAVESVVKAPEIDLVLMDIDLGTGIDGVEAASRILELRELPVVFLTSHAEKEMVDRVKRVTRYGYVLKSSGEFVLLESVSMAFDLFEAHRRLSGVDTVQSASDPNYLRDELRQLLQQDPAIFDFIEAGSLDGMWYWDIESPENEWMSPRFWETFGYDPLEKRHDPAEWQDLIYEEDLKVALDNFQKHLADPTHPYDQVVRYRHRDGGTVWVRCRGIAIRDDQGRPLRMLGAHNDITQLKETELQLRRLVAEKTTLMREVHHRVKNNLAMVSSLLSLKEDALAGVADLSDLRGQVSAIFSAYDMLSATDDVTSVDLGSYVGDLLGPLAKGYASVRLSVDISDVSFSGQNAVIFGLIVNELATNALKHGLRPGEEIMLSVHHTLIEGESIHRFQVSNNGRPVPDSINPNEATTLGLHLVSTLVRQLGGALELHRDPTTFVVSVPCAAVETPTPVS